MNPPTMCKRCVLVESKPDIWLDERGICNLCLDFEKGKSSQQGNSKLLETDLIRTLNKYKGNGQYDCLVMCSGGKDSTSTLYYMVKKYRMRPLAFTFEHGFAPEEAVKNIKNAVDTLKVDWLFFKSDFMQDFFAEIIKTKAKVPICPPCSIWYMQLVHDVAKRYNIPLIIAGWTRGQFTRQEILTNDTGGSPPEPEFVSLAAATSDFIDRIRKKYPKYKDFPKTVNEVKKKYKGIMALSPHWFLQKDAREYTELIKRELHWEPIPISYPAGSTNCYLNNLGAYLSIKHYGFNHYHIEMSNLIRLGEISREEALKALEIDIDKEPMSSVISSVLNKLGCHGCHLVDS